MTGAVVFFLGALWLGLSFVPLPVIEGVQVIQEGPSPREGLADLRWVMFNSHEFRFIP
jgi:hypothetical protein